MLETKAAWENDSFKFRRDAFYEIGGECSVVGKEDCSERLIVAWKRWQDNGNIGHYEVNGKDDEVAVKIGLFDIKTTDIDVIFTSSEQLNIIHCTVDANLKTLAMVCETVPSYGFSFSESSPTDYSAEVTYSCYWTPLRISDEELTSILPLNKESDQMMKVQLLSTTQLLILIPREAIYLYTLPTCDSGGYHNAMVSPVLYERLIGPFLWAEYNTSVGQLFYIHLKSSVQTSDAHDISSSTIRNGRLSPVLIGLQFHNGTVFETVLNTPVDLLLRITSLSERNEPSNITCKFNPLSNKICNPVLKMEISIFTLPEGEVYICQGIVGTSAKDGTVLSDDEDSCEIDIKYDISLLHHSCTLHGQIKGNLQNNVLNKKIMFVPIQGSILVVMPGVFTHLLDIGLEHEPCNHILLLGCALPLIGSDEVTDIFSTSRLSKRSFSYIICKPGEIRQLLVSVTNHSLLDTFNSNSIHGTTVQQTIIHHLLVHYCDVSNAEKLMKNLSVDPTEPHVVKLFQEFLLGGSFVHAKHHVDKKCCPLLPMSVAEPFHPQHESYLDGKIQMTTTYTMMKNVKSVLLSPTERHITHHRVVDLWFRLWQHLRTRSSVQVAASPRFSSKAMRDDLLASGNCHMQRGAQPLSNPDDINFTSNAFCPLSYISQECSVHPATSFCRKFLGPVSEKKEITSFRAKIRSYLPDDEIEGVCGDGYSRLEQIVSLNLREITTHLTKHLPAAPANVVKECASLYVADRLDQSQVLCHIIFQLANIKSSVQELDYDPYIFLNNLSSSGARTLFSWLERYLVAAEDIVFPLPKGFEAFFSVLAYKCLNIRMFLQYVDFGVVQLNAEVLRCITADSKAVVKTMPQSQLNDDNVMVEIISRLPKSAAIQFLQHLKCHTTRLLQVHNIVERYCNHQCNPKSKRFSSSSEMPNSHSSGGTHYESVVSQGRPEDENISSESESDDEFSYSACESETLDLPTPIITAMTSFMCFLQEGDFYSNVYTRSSTLKTKQKTMSRVPCASASDMKFIKDTQLRNIASESSSASRSQCSKIRPPVVVYWR